MWFNKRNNKILFAYKSRNERKVGGEKMAHLRITPTGNHLVNCNNEDELFDKIQQFEEYLMKNGVKPLVKIGSMYMDSLSFDFTVTSEEEDVKSIVYGFFKGGRPKIYSKYRLIIHRKDNISYYPFNDLKTALLFFKVLQTELREGVKLELLRYYPHAKGDWITWKDREGKTANQIQVGIQNEELTLINLVQ